MRCVYRLLGLMIMGTLFSQPARAEEYLPKKVFAVLVAPGKFTDPQIKPRPSAENDGLATYNLLTNPDYLGIPKEQIKLFLSEADEKKNALKATKENVLTSLKEIAKQATKDDLVLISFIGQGASAGERTCFFLADSTFKERAKSAMLSTDIEPIFKNFPAQLCLMLDIYVKGFDAGKETVLAPSVEEFARSFLGLQDRDESSTPTGRAVIIASRGINTPLTLNEGKDGLFTSVLLDALKGKADKEGGQADGNISIDEVITHIDKEIPALAREIGKTNEEKIVIPLGIRDASTHFIVTHNPEEFTKVKTRLAAWDKIVAENKVEENIKAEGYKLLTRMPKLKLWQDLRNDYQKVVNGKMTLAELSLSREKFAEATKISTEDSREYAGAVLAGLDYVDRNFVKDINVGELVAKAVRGLYLKADEKLPSEMTGRLDKAKTLRKSELRQLLTDARLTLGKREDLDNKADVEASLDFALRKLDPYTQYIRKEFVERTTSQVSGNFSGIGVQIRRDIVKDGLLVITPIKGSPAYKAGLKQGDLITKILRKVDSEGKPLEKEEVTLTKGMDVEDAVKLILGKPGTEVEVTVQREGENKPLEFKIRRGSVVTESVLGYQRNSDDSWDYFLDPQTKIAYIRLTSFQSRSAKEMKDAVENLTKQGMKGLVLDLRFNPGGLLNVANEICDLFIDDGVLVAIKERGKETRTFSGASPGSQTYFPMVCMVNGFSASGSEIVGACLTDHRRALIVGERSFGKGSVQTLQPFDVTGGEIKITTAAFLAPSLRNLNKSSTNGKEEEDWGVRPDEGYNLKLTPEETNELADQLQDREIIPNRNLPPKKEAKPFKDRQLDAAVEYLKQQIRMTAQTTPKKGD